MAKQLMEDEDNLRRQARRRLIGAVALTTAIVVVLPMLLDSEPKPVGKDIEIRIPDKDKVAEFEPKISMPSAPIATLPASADEAASAPAASSQMPAPPAAPAVAVAPPVAAPHPSKPASPQVKPAAPQESFVVQIGAFTNAGSAQRLQKKLHKQGIKTYTEKIDDKTRVRAGPYATREAADKIVHKLEKQGLKPVISQTP